MLFIEARFVNQLKPKPMDRLINFDLLFSIQVAVMVMGAICIIYLLHKIWKQK